MSEFIKVEIDPRKCTGPEECGECLKVCPVNIFLEQAGGLAVDQENEDECILCDLCLNACAPGAVLIRKLYEE